jgi:RNA polymerase sigma factor (sigma-70 family)
MKPDSVEVQVLQKEIIAGCIRGDRRSQRQLYERYSSRLYGICLMYTTDPMEAEDTLHDGFMKIFSSIGQYKGEGSFEGWMRRIMVNTSLEKYRRGKRLQTIMDAFRYEGSDVTEHILDELTAKEIMDAVMELSPQYRVSFLLYAVEGYSHKEIAEQLGISEGTSKSNLSRARGILQDRLRRYYADHGSSASVIPMIR